MTLVDKALQACLAAIEIYNKPDFQYREETFSILMLNSWELLLKARVMKEHGGRLRAIEVWKPILRRDGMPGTRLRPMKNRSGNTMTISLSEALGIVRGLPNPGIDDRCVENLFLLTDIRDSAIHLRNISAGLGQRIQEAGSAALRNFVRAGERWFDFDLDRFNFYIMPIAFHSPASVVESLSGKKDSVAMKNLLRQISDAEAAHPSDETANFNVTLKIELRFTRTAHAEAIPVHPTRDPGAVPIEVTEENIRRMFPWDYDDLVAKLKERYRDFKQNEKFYSVKRQLEHEEKHCKLRLLDPENPTGLKKKFYSPGILGEFDMHYARR